MKTRKMGTKNILINTFYFELQGCHHYVFLGRGHLTVEEDNLYMEYSNDPNLLERTVASVSKDRRGENSIRSDQNIEDFRVPLDVVLRLEESVQNKNRFEVLEFLREIDQYKKNENKEN